LRLANHDEKQVQEQYGQEFSNYQQQIESLQGQMRATEWTNIRRESHCALVDAAGGGHFCCV
jgi:hypothetical protein